MDTEIFISYTWSKDTFDAINDFHKELEKLLQKKPDNKNFKVFYDKENITEGKPESYFKPILEAHLDSSKILIVLLSEDWLKSKWCNWEFKTFTHKLNKQVIVVKWSDYESNLQPFSKDTKKSIENLEQISFMNKKNKEQFLADLKARISELLEIKSPDVT